MTNSVTIHMGFLNTPYTKETMKAPMRTAREHEKKRRRNYSKTKTAESVANILENKYGILNIFMNHYEEEIQELITEKVNDYAIQSFAKLGNSSKNKMATFMKPNTTEIEKMFRDFLDKDETNIYIEAAMHRNKPAFIKTGLYRASFRVWAE